MPPANSFSLEDSKIYRLGKGSSSGSRFNIYVTLHALPLGKLASNLSFHMNIHMVGKNPNSQLKDP